MYLSAAPNTDAQCAKEGRLLAVLRLMRSWIADVAAMSAFGMNDGPSSTHIGLWRFSGRLAGILCKRPFIEIVEKIRIRLTRPWADFYRRVSKIATDRPLSKMRRCANDRSDITRS
jgi:hypothetical protein